MALSVVVASGTADVQAAAGPVTVVGYSVREAAGTPGAAAVVLRDGTDTSGIIKVTIGLAASGGHAAILPAVTFNTGIFVDRLSGTTELVLYVA